MLLGPPGSPRIIPPVNIRHLVTCTKSLLFHRAREQVLGIECGNLWGALFCLPKRHPNMKMEPWEGGGVVRGNMAAAGSGEGWVFGVSPAGFPLLGLPVPLPC